MATITLTDIGRVEVVVGPNQTVSLDLFKVYNKLADLYRRWKNEDDPSAAEYSERVLDLMVEEGLPRMSQWAAEAFETQVCRLAIDAKKALAPQPADSPG